MSDSASRALDLLTLGEIRRSAEGRRLLDLALGTDDAAREARERLDVSASVVEPWREFRRKSLDREQRALAGWKRLGARAAAGESDALVELLSLARFLVRERVPKLGNLDHAMVEAVSAALGGAINRARPKATKRHRRNRATALEIAGQVQHLEAVYLDRTGSLRPVVAFCNIPPDLFGPADLIHGGLSTEAAVAAVARQRGVTERTIYNYLRTAREAVPSPKGTKRSRR
ncbi:MAG: hypothetical protein AMXMBFR36_27820 [Acidobacteriota bacterium]